MIDIKLFYDSALDCFEDAVASVSNYFGYGFELAFAEKWGFGFTPLAPGESELVCKRINAGMGRIWELFTNYHGVKIIIHENNEPTDRLNIVRAQLAKGFPVVIGLDIFWCNWSNWYQKNYGRHFCLIRGEDKENLFNCLDMVNKDDNLTLPIDDFLKGSHVVFTFEFLDKDSIQVDRLKVLEDSVKRIYSPEEGINVFENMRAFGREVAVGLDMKHEISQNNNDLIASPIIRGTLELSQGRMKYARALSNIARHENISELMDISEEIKECGNIWMTVRGLLVRAFYLDGAEDLYSRVSAKVLAAADKEEAVAIRLLKLVEKIKTAGFVSSSASEKTAGKSKNLEDKEAVFVELFETYNAKGIGESTVREYNANLDGGGSYILTEKLPKSDVWQFNDTKFLAPRISKENNDNISCSNQKVAVPKGSYSSIAILACAEFGNYADKLELKFEDGSSENIPLEFSDWYVSPLYGETIAWIGTAAIWSNDSDIPYIANSVKLYTQTYTIQNNGALESIHIPDCPNIHIFGITLYK